MTTKRQLTLGEAIARLYPRLPAKAQQALTPLLPRLQENDPSAQIQALEALRPWPEIGAWLKAVTSAGGVRGYASPAGTPAPPPVSRYWICPRYEECGEWEPMIQIGEPAPQCPRHGLPMRLHSGEV